MSAISEGDTVRITGRPADSRYEWMDELLGKTGKVKAVSDRSVKVRGLYFALHSVERVEAKTEEAA